MGNYIAVYLAFSALFWLARFLLADYVNIRVGWRDLAMIPIVPLEMYWFLWVLIVYYAVGYGALNFLEGHSDLIWLSVAVALSFASGHALFHRLPGALNAAAQYAVAFFAGAYGCAHGFPKGRAALIPAALLSADVSAAILGFGWTPADIPVVGTLAALLLSLTFVGLFLHLPCAPLAWLGRYALEIYLFQHYAIAVVRRMIVRLSLPVNAATIAASTLIEALVPALIGMALRALRLYQPLLRPASWLAEHRRQRRSSPRFS